MYLQTKMPIYARPFNRQHISLIPVDQSYDYDEIVPLIIPLIIYL